MALFNAAPTKMAVLKGLLKASAAFTNVIGGAMTAGTVDSEASGKITFDAFKSIPAIFVQSRGGGSANVVAYGALVTGITTTQAFIAQHLSGGQTASGTDIDILIFGEARL